MATGIQWTNETWNPVRGCSLVSEGCRNCYAMKTAARFDGPGQPYEGLTVDRGDGPKWTGEVRTVPKKLRDPLSWSKPRMVFVNSMSDLFHADVPFDFIDQAFAVMAIARRHTFQVLTKRPERMLEYMTTRLRIENVYAYWHSFSGAPAEMDAWPLPNVWLGTSIENQKAADERIPHLLKTPAAVRFLSCEPLLSAVDLTKCGEDESRCIINAVSGKNTWNGRRAPKVDWVIVGGESGHEARICHAEWIGSIIQQCQAAGVPVFHKQHGSVWARSHGWKDPKGGDPAEWHEDLRVREFPASSASRSPA